MTEFCMWCGRNPASDEHHLFRRSASPKIIDDSKNKVKLCRTCHEYATNEKEVEQLFQEYFFLKPEQEKLSIDYVAEQMKSGGVISPRDISRFRNYLAGEYFFFSDRFVELERRKQFAVEEFKKEEGVKSEARAERMYQMTDDGLLYMELRQKLKALEKMLSALRTAFEQYIKEGQNIF